MLNFTVWIKTAVPWGAVMNQTQLVLLEYEAGAFGESSWWVWSCCSWMTWLPHDGARKKKNCQINRLLLNAQWPNIMLMARDIFFHGKNKYAPLYPTWISKTRWATWCTELEAVPFWAIVVESGRTYYLEEPYKPMNLTRTINHSPQPISSCRLLHCFMPSQMMIGEEHSQNSVTL